MATTPEPHKIPIQKYSAWNKEVKADWWAVLRGLTKMGAGVGATVMDPATGFSAVIQGIFDGAVDIASAFKAEDKVSYQAYKLILLSFSIALKELLDDEEYRLRPYDAGKHQRLLDKLNEALQGQEVTPELKTLEEKVLELEEKTLQLGKDFFKDPAGLSIISDFRPLFVQWICETHDLPGHVARSIYNRFPRVFTFELHRQWKKHKDYFKPLLEELESPFYPALEKEIQRIQYDEWLKSLPFEPLLDEPFSVNDVYIPLRAYWTEKKKKDDQVPERDVIRIEDAETHFFSWLQSKESKNKAFVVQGGPGSGKSIFSKRIVAEATKKGMKCYFMPLHRLNAAEGSTEEKILKYINGMNNPALQENPFGFQSSDGEADCLFVLDGLDEISKAGKASEEAAKKFIVDFFGLIDNRAYYGNSRVFITGRDLVIQQNSPEFKNRGKVVKLAPFFTRPLLAKLKSERLNSFSADEEEELFNQDQRKDWWRKYSFFKKGEEKGMPEAIQSTSSDELIELSSEPLLSYLLARSLDSELNLKTIQQNINLVYKQLVKDVYERVHGKNALSPQYQHLKIDFDDYLELMEEVAMAAWMSGDSRTVSYADTLKRCSQYGLDSTLARFEGNNEKGLFSLLISFFFHRPSSENRERTFEFTHKTFGEYLAASRVARFGLDLVKNLQHGMKEGENGTEKYEYDNALGDWLRFCGDAEVSESIMKFLWRELTLILNGERYRDREDIESIQITLVDLFNHILKYGWPSNLFKNIDRLPQISRLVRNAETTLLFLLSGISQALQKAISFNWPNNQSAREWLSKLCPSRSGKEEILFQGLSYFDFQGQNLMGVNFWRANLEYANFNNAILFHGIFSVATLKGANFNQSDAQSAIFLYSDLSGSNFEEANLEESKFNASNMENVNLGAAILVRANLEDVNLRSAVLDRATLDYSNLSGAFLSDASLLKTNLFDVKFDKANLSKVKLNKALLFRCDLTGSIMDDETRFSREQLNLEDYRLANKIDNVLVDGDILSGQPLRDFLESIAVEDDDEFPF